MIYQWRSEKYISAKCWKVYRLLKLITHSKTVSLPVRTFANSSYDNYTCIWYYACNLSRLSLTSTSIWQFRTRNPQARAGNTYFVFRTTDMYHITHYIPWNMDVVCCALLLWLYSSFWCIHVIRFTLYVKSTSLAVKLSVDTSTANDTRNVSFRRVLYSYIFSFIENIIQYSDTYRSYIETISNHSVYHCHIAKSGVNPPKKYTCFCYIYATFR